MIKHFALAIVIAATVLSAPATDAKAAMSSGKAYDLVGAAALRDAVPSITANSYGVSDTHAVIHRNFAQVIEQNFARLDALRARKVIDQLSDVEMRDLAQLYANANADFGRADRLLDILVGRLDSRQLARIARFFGSAPVMAAIMRTDPGKLAAWPSISIPAPTPGAALLTLSTSTAASKVPVVAGALAYPGVGTMAAPVPGQFLDYTPSEIYLSFRTAPVGALGAGAAFWETAYILGNAVTWSAGAGWTIGTAITYVWSTYYPSSYSAFSSMLGSIVDSVTTSGASGTEATQGQNQSSSSSSPAFGLTSTMIRDLENGGDDGVSVDWDYFGEGGANYGGGGCVANCPPIDQM